jgi:hypothetical protein
VLKESFGMGTVLASCLALYRCSLMPFLVTLEERVYPKPFQKFEVKYTQYKSYHC